MLRKPGHQIGGAEGRMDFQAEWHKWFDQAFFEPGWRVLDIGSGLGHVKSRIRGVRTSDIFPGCADFVDDPDRSYFNYGPGSFDYVTLFDVIEHIKNDVDALYYCCRVAKKGVFLTTPNYRVSRCGNEYHFREYLPHQLRILCEQQEAMTKFSYYQGTSDGSVITRVADSLTFDSTTSPHLGALLLR